MSRKAISPSRQNATGLRGYLAGNYPLRTVFWVFGVSGGVACVLGMYALATVAPFLKAAAWQFGMLYTIAWWRASWLSADRYAGPRVWRRGAKAAVMATAVLAAGVVLYAGLVAYPVPANSGA